jgi:cell division protein FtsZ
VTFEIVSPITDIDFTISSPVAEVKSNSKNYRRQDKLLSLLIYHSSKAEPVAQS